LASIGAAAEVGYDGHHMAVYLDDECVELAGDDLESLLTVATEYLLVKGRIVVEVQMEGESLGADDLDQKQNEPLGGREVRLYSADPHDLAITTLQQAKTQLEDAKQWQLEAAQLFQEDKQDEAMRQLAGSINIWQQTQQAVMVSVDLLNIDLESKTVDGRTAAQVTDIMIQKLEPLRDLLMNKDTVGLADTLEYELPEAIDQWDRFIAALIGWIRESDTIKDR